MTANDREAARGATESDVHAPGVLGDVPPVSGARLAHPLPDGVSDTFVRPCTDCGKTVRVVGGQQEPHEHQTFGPLDRLAAFAWWQGHDAVKAVVDAEQSELKAEAERLREENSNLLETLERVVVERDAFKDERNEARAEVERLREDVAEYDGILSRQGDLLTRTVNALKGDPAPLTTWSHHDVPELAEQMATDVRNLLRDKGTISALVTQNRSRAESAEAALVSEREAHAGLRARLEALADEWEGEADRAGRVMGPQMLGVLFVVRHLRALAAEPAAPVAAEEGGEEECSYEEVWTDEVGTIPVCVVHGNNSRHTESNDPHRPCLTVDPYPAPSGSDEQGNRTATPDANGVHDTKGGGA